MKKYMASRIIKELIALRPKMYNGHFDKKGYRETCNQERNQIPRLQTLPGKWESNVQQSLNKDSEVNYTA